MRKKKISKYDDKKVYDIEITGGFFWNKINGCIRRNNDKISVKITYNAFMDKPKWYQIKKWWFAFNLWRKM